MLKTTKILTMMLVLMMGMSFASCDEFLSNNDNPVSPNLKVQTTSLTVQVGKTAKCKATASSKARLTFFSSDESIATVSTSGVVKGISVGTTYVTALATNPAGSDVFLEESAIITVNVVEKDKEPEEPEEPGTMTVTAEGYTGTYDGEAHSIKVTAPEGATVKYGEAEGTYDLDTNPTYKNAGTYTLYYQVTKDSYDTVSGSATVTINKADMTVTAEGFSGVYDGLDHSITVTAPSGATVKYGTSADNCTETSLAYTDAGTYTIFYEVTKDNYNTVTGSATVDISLSTMTVTATGYTGTYDGDEHGITVTAPTNASVRYGETEGKYDKTSSPTYTDAGTHTVYYQVKKVGYTTVTGSATVTINKAAGTISFSTDTVEKLNSDSAFQEVATLTGDGTISGYSSSVPGVATVAADGTVTIVSTGTTVITATATDGTNYKYTSGSYTLTVKGGGLNGPTTYNGGENPF